MNRKNIISLTITLILGFTIGFFVSGRLSKRRIHHYHQTIRDHRMLGEHIMQQLELNTEQQEAIEPKLDSMLSLHMKIRKQHRRERDSLHNQMKEELMPLLTPEQQERLLQMRKRHHRRMHR